MKEKQHKIERKIWQKKKNLKVFSFLATNKRQKMQKYSLNRLANGSTFHERKLARLGMFIFVVLLSHTT